ncbi:uncharacterized protein LOC122388577 [Amphibalanus amphitrite]|uniref:uncharacterized protein LOC122388577 n=1 Tax=Amphibalanus amphitrite TaxID=1232801 RepID=UPI001C9249F9|nr:uncharacterized protein LOC122388577 [Amphibalanus amphitrite]
MTAEKPAAAAKKLQAVGQETLAEDSQDSLARYNTIMVTVILAIFSLCVMVTTEGAIQELRAGDFFCKLDGTLTCQNYTVRCVGEGFINCDGPSSTRESATLVLKMMTSESDFTDQFPDLLAYLQSLVTAGTKTNDSMDTGDVVVFPKSSTTSGGGFDLSQPAKPSAKTGGFDLSQPAKATVTTGGFDLSQPAKVPMKSGGFDLSQPAKYPAKTGGFDLSQPAKPAVKAGGFDLSQPAKAPGKTGGFDLSQPAKPAVKAGGFNLSQPAKPAMKTGGFDLSQPAKAPVKTGGFDLSQPAKPAMKTGGFDLSQPAKPSVKTGGFDLSQPAKAPVKTGEFDLSQPAKAPAATGGFDLSQPAIPPMSKAPGQLNKEAKMTTTSPTSETLLTPSLRSTPTASPDTLSVTTSAGVAATTGATSQGERRQRAAGRDDARHHSMPIKKKAESDDKPDGGEGEKKKTLLRQLDSLRTQLVDNDNETFTANSSTSKALDVLEAELQRPADSEGTSCTVARMVCSELPPLSSCTGTSAGKCHEKQPMTREGMMVALLVPITITTIGIMIYVLFWKRVGSQVDVEQPSAERAGAAKKAEAGASQPAA